MSSGSGSSSWETIQDVAADEGLTSYFFGKTAAIMAPKRASLAHKVAADSTEIAIASREGYGA